MDGYWKRKNTHKLRTHHLYMLSGIGLNNYESDQEFSQLVS